MRAERQVLPVEVDRPADRAVGVDQARRADPDAEEGARGLTPDVVDELVDELDGRVAVTALELAGALRGDLAAQVRERGGERALAEVEGDDGPGVVLEGDEGRLLAAGARAATDVLGQAIRAQVRDELADAGPRQAGQAGDVRAADRPEVVERAQDEGRVVGARLAWVALDGNSVRATGGMRALATSSRELTKRIVVAVATTLSISRTKFPILRGSGGWRPRLGAQGVRRRRPGWWSPRRRGCDGGAGRPRSGSLTTGRRRNATPAAAWGGPLTCG